MKVIGVGCGPGLLTQEALMELRDARKLYGSGRAIELAKDHISPGCEVLKIADYSKIGEMPGDAVILSTGDPMLAGLGRAGAENVPGISSMQVAFARLGLPLVGAIALSAHGRGHEMAIYETMDELRRGRHVYIIADPGFDIKVLARRLLSEGLDCHLAICEDLGYNKERISVGTAVSPPAARSKLFSVVAWREGSDV